MSTLVTLQVYSGLPNPSWELTDAETDELRARLQAIENRSLSKPPGLSGRLGYRGFSIETVGERNLDASMYAHGGVVDVGQFDLSLRADSSEFEAFLLATAGNAISSALKDYIAEQIASHFDSADSFGAVDEPSYNPGKWNNDPNIRMKNNCYNYANDKITNTFAQPGRGTGSTGPYPPQCSGTGDAAVRDGLSRVSNPSMTPAQGQIVALVVSPQPHFLDYHWYRRDSNGMWSHKAGETPARNTDNSGQLISNPETCDRGPYTNFCGYFHSVSAQVTIR